MASCTAIGATCDICVRAYELTEAFDGKGRVGESSVLYSAEIFMRVWAVKWMGR